VKAVYLLLNKPMRVERLAEAVDLPLRQTYRIINHLKATGWLQCDRTYYWLTINP
jgi:DNA-binding IclR family transcriptional regulator